MSFADTDPLEDDMGIRCENMTPDQLVAYIKAYQDAFGFNLKVEGAKERGVFRGLQRVYGVENAGRIVKWAFYHHKGKFRDEIINFFHFSKGNKWLTDKFYLELQQATAKEHSAADRFQGASLGVTRLSDL